MAVDFDELDAVVDMVGGVPEAYGLSFLAVRPHTTLHFERDGSVHLYVFVDRDNLPVGMALVHSAARVQYREVPRGGDECRRLVTDLYGTCASLAARARPAVPEKSAPAASESDKPHSNLILPILPREGWRPVA